MDNNYYNTISDNAHGAHKHGRVLEQHNARAKPMTTMNQWKYVLHAAAPIVIVVGVVSAITGLYALGHFFFVDYEPYVPGDCFDWLGSYDCGTYRPTDDEWRQIQLESARKVVLMIFGTCSLYGFIMQFERLGTASRLRDLEWSPNYKYSLLIPVIGLVMIIPLLILPGKHRYYNGDPK